MNTPETVTPQYTHIIDDEDFDPALDKLANIGKKQEGTMSFSDIYSRLLVMDSLVVEIKPSQIASLRKGLSDAKWKMNDKLKAEGQEPDDRRISFKRINETKDVLRVEISFQDNGINLVIIDSDMLDTDKKET